VVPPVSTTNTLPLDMEQTRAGDRNDPKNLERVAAEFESLLITQMLRAAHEASGESWFGEGEDQAGANMVAIAEESLARALSSAGGIGLGRLVVSGLQLETEQVTQNFRTSTATTLLQKSH
jgi:Rod binding domain-containing protein